MTKKLKFSNETTKLLLDWYDKNARKLPWRSEPTPYHVWVSEIMLQQTRVETGLPYYNRFIEVLPNIDALAEADDELLLKLWEGLGYYSRVRNMKKAAMMICDKFDGEIPKDIKEVESLPGIGNYTAGAICSIAFGMRVPAVDGNVLRVGSRLLGSKENISEEGIKKVYAERIMSILPETRSGDFNQALMDLGATVCIPKKPKCHACPLMNICDGYQKGLAEELPVKAAPLKRKREKKTVLLVVCKNEVALQKRPPTGILAGLWEFPCVEGHLSADEVCAYLEENGCMARIKEMPASRHIFSHKEWEMKAFFVYVEKQPMIENWIFEKWDDIKGKKSIPSAYKTYSDILDDFFDE